jgi:hypothetical protein
LVLISASFASRILQIQLTIPVKARTCLERKAKPPLKVVEILSLRGGSRAVTQEQVKMFGLSRRDVKVAALAAAMVLVIELILPGKSLLMSCPNGTLL